MVRVRLRPSPLTIAGFRGLLPRCAAWICRDRLRTTHDALPASVLRGTGVPGVAYPLPPPTPPSLGGDPENPIFDFPGYPLA